MFSPQNDCAVEAKVREAGGFGFQVVRAIIIPNVAGVIVQALYCILFAGFAGVRLSPGVVVSGVLLVLLQLPFSFLTHKLVLGELFGELTEWVLHSSTDRERTRLLRKVMDCPLRLATLVFVLLLGSSVLWLLVLRWLFFFTGESLVMAAGAAVMGNFTTTILILTSCQKRCSVYGYRLVAQGVDRDEVQVRQFFGMRFSTMAVLYGLVPLLMTSCISVAVVWRSYLIGDVQVPFQLVYVCLISGVNLIFMLLFAMLLFRKIKNPVVQMRDMLESMDMNGFHPVQYAPTDLSNSFMYNVHLVNSILSFLQDILHNSREVSNQVVMSSMELDGLSHTTLATAMEQSQDIWNLLAAMERVDVMSRTVAYKIADVALVAHKTGTDVQEGIAILTQKIQKLDDIHRTSAATFGEIRLLGEKMSSISDIALIINSIADQTSLIAFNAELEATTSGHAVQGFLLVAKEIRELTGSIVDLTKEIRSSVAEINHTIRELEAGFFKGSDLLEEEKRMTRNLFTSFHKIQVSAETADTSSMEIQSIVGNQSSAFEQVVETLRQIAAATEELAVSIKTVSLSARNFSVAASQLAAIEQDLDGKKEETQ